MNDTTNEPTTVELTRVFNAPRDLVFSMFTDEKHMSRWWGPLGYSSPNTKLEPKVNGAVWLDMQGPDGIVIYNRGKFVEIEKPSKLVFILRALTDSEGVPQMETHNTFVFTEEDGKTILHMIAVITKANAAVADALAGMYEGWSQSLDKLEQTITAAAKELA